MKQLLFFRRFLASFMFLAVCTLSWADDYMSIEDLPSNIPTSSYGTQDESDESTWLSWTWNGVDFMGAKICKASNANGGGIQMQASKGFIFNKSAWPTDINKITIVLKVVNTSTKDPAYTLYVGSNPHPTTTAITPTSQSEEVGGFKVYTQVFDLSNVSAKYFTIDNRSGALYIDKVYINEEGGTEDPSGLRITDVNQLDIHKCYYIYTKDQLRGGLGVNMEYSRLASTYSSVINEEYRTESMSPFVFYEADFNSNVFYLYSVEANACVTSSGGLTNKEMESNRINITKNANGYFMFSFASTGNVLNINTSPGIEIDGWGTWTSQYDDGNQFVIELAGDFDPSVIDLIDVDGWMEFENAEHYAQAPIQSISSLVNSQVYTAVTKRAAWYVPASGTQLESTAVPIGVDLSCRDAGQQFAFILHNGNYYVYSVGEKKILNGITSNSPNRGVLVTENCQPVTIQETGDTNYPLFFSFGEYYNINIGGSSEITIDSWSTMDDGNKVALQPVQGVTLTDEDLRRIIGYIDKYKATGISLNRTSATLTTKGQTLQLTATVTPDNATNKSVTWTSSNTAVATVSSTGLVTAVANGTATITATTADGSNKTATCTVTVNIPVPVTGITLNKTTATLTSKGPTLQLSATVTPSNATNKSVTWTSSNTAVATVSNIGLVTAVGAGTATITAAATDGSGITATCKVTVIAIEATFNGSNAKLSANWYADGSMEPRSGLQEMHAVHYQPGNTDRSGDGTSITNNKVFVFNLLSGFRGGAINAETSDAYGLSTELTIVFDTSKYQRGITQVGLSGKLYTMSANKDVVSATCNGETLPVVRLMDTYKNKEGRWIEFQNNDFAMDLLNAAPIFNADGKTTDAFYTEMTLASKENILMNITGDTDFRVRYFRPIDITHVHSGKSYLKDGAEAGYDELYIADIFTFTDWRQTLPFGYNITSRGDWMEFYGIHDIYFNKEEIETDVDGRIEKLDDPNLSLEIKYPGVKRESSYGNRETFNHIGVVRYQNNGGAVASYNLFIPFHIVHNWGEVVVRLQVPIVGTFDDETNIYWLEDNTVLATGVELNKTELSLAIGNTEKLTATVKPTDATNRSVTWRSTDVTVVTVDNDGLVTAVGSGTAQIIATTADGSNKIASCIVMVSLSGDINGDGDVNGADIVAVIDYVLNDSKTEGDVNGDGEVNGADIVAVIDYVLSYTGDAVRQQTYYAHRAPARPADTSDRLYANTDVDGITVGLTNETDFTAFQFMLQLPEDCTLENVIADGLRLNNHLLQFRRMADGRYFVLGYNLDNENIAGHDGALLRLQLAGNICEGASVTDVMFFTPEAETRHLAGIQIDLVTGLTSPEHVTENIIGNIYDMQGRIVMTSGQFAKQKNFLPTGIYIRNGRKFIVK